MTIRQSPEGGQRRLASGRYADPLWEGQRAASMRVWNMVSRSTKQMTPAGSPKNRGSACVTCSSQGSGISHHAALRGKPMVNETAPLEVSGHGNHLGLDADRSIRRKVASIIDHGCTGGDVEAKRPASSRPFTFMPPNGHGPQGICAFLLIGKRSIALP